MDFERNGFPDDSAGSSEAALRAGGRSAELEVFPDPSWQEPVDGFLSDELSQAGSVHLGVCRTPKVQRVSVNFPLASSDEGGENKASGVVLCISEQQNTRQGPLMSRGGFFNSLKKTTFKAGDKFKVKITGIDCSQFKREVADYHDWKRQYFLPPFESDTTNQSFITGIFGLVSSATSRFLDRFLNHSSYSFAVNLSNTWLCYVRISRGTRRLGDSDDAKTNVTYVCRDWDSVRDHFSKHDSALFYVFLGGAVVV
ncbi:hypothetical protein K438DRAFT_1770557 [Mycena galopus ATCC 62051]|nr:hypothetical protein K438DRAFT_1770557 [Mycena galopus ATCC 62051]